MYFSIFLLSFGLTDYLVKDIFIKFTDLLSHWFLVFSLFKTIVLNFWNRGHLEMPEDTLVSQLTECCLLLKDDAVKVLHSICQQIWKTQQWPQYWKRSVFISIPKKGNDKECSNYCTIAIISHPSKVMFKILQARLHQYMNWELPDIQAGFRKGRGTEIKYEPTSIGS